MTHKNKPEAGNPASSDAKRWATAKREEGRFAHSTQPLSQAARGRARSRPPLPSSPNGKRSGLGSAPLLPARDAGDLRACRALHWRTLPALIRAIPPARPPLTLHIHHRNPAPGAVAAATHKHAPVHKRGGGVWAALADWAWPVGLSPGHPGRGMATAKRHDKQVPPLSRILSLSQTRALHRALRLRQPCPASEREPRTHPAPRPQPAPALHCPPNTHAIALARAEGEWLC